MAVNPRGNQAQSSDFLENPCVGQRRQQTQNLLSLLQRSTRQLADNKWMANDLLFK